MRVLTIGTFDLFHDGHIDLFRRCKGLVSADGPIRHAPYDGARLSNFTLTIGVNSDEFVELYKGARPVVPYASRAASVSAYGDVAKHEGNTARFISENCPHVIVIGSDWARKDYLAQIQVDQDWLDVRDISVMYASRPPHGTTTTALKVRDLT